ncbi:hypothetical protein F5Y13DRAFT_157853 [Hypoxylon sp. FL1857]|nr:hypothetical protein F5Y13DRAFT_157853 [Hypoxylon sp. FL1857]
MMCIQGHFVAKLLCLRVNSVYFLTFHSISGPRSYLVSLRSSLYGYLVLLLMGRVLRPLPSDLRQVHMIALPLHDPKAQHAYCSSVMSCSPMRKAFLPAPW